MGNHFNVKRYKDLILNTIAIGLPIGILQLFIYPNLARELGNEEYGLLISIYSIWTLVSGALSGALNSIKLVRNNKYNNEGLDGDYPIISTRWAFIISFVCFFAIWIYIGEFKILNIILGTISALLMYYEMYYECSFRINISFINILICKMILVVGYIVGYFAFTITKYWEFIFIFGYGFSFAYCIFKSNFIKEKFTKTKYYSETLRGCNYIAISNFVDNLSTYADKLVLYPLMGGNVVTIYYTSMLIGKVVSMIASSLRDVILSYISKNTKNDEKFNTKSFVISFFLIVVCYLVLMFVNKWMIGFLYPQLIQEIVQYLPLALAITMLDVFATILHPYTLKYCEAKWQILISVLSTSANFITSLILWSIYGLTGFYIGAIIGQMSRIIMFMYVYYNKSININEK